MKQNILATLLIMLFVSLAFTDAVFARFGGGRRSLHVGGHSSHKAKKSSHKVKKQKAKPKAKKTSHKTTKAKPKKEKKRSIVIKKIIKKGRRSAQQGVFQVPTDLSQPGQQADQTPAETVVQETPVETLTATPDQVAIPDVATTSGMETAMESVPAP